MNRKVLLIPSLFSLKECQKSVNACIYLLGTMRYIGEADHEHHSFLTDKAESYGAHSQIPWRGHQTTIAD